MIQVIRGVMLLMMFSASASAQLSHSQSVEEIKHRFIEALTENWQDFKVCEYYNAATDKKIFIDKSIDPSLTRGAEKITYKEIYLTNQLSGKAVHLGVVIIQFPKSSPIDYSGVNVEDAGYFQNTKILTHYVLNKMPTSIVVYYSETYLDENVKKFLLSVRS